MAYAEQAMPPRKLTRKFPNYHRWAVFGKQWHISHTCPIILPLLVNIIRARGIAGRCAWLLALQGEYFAENLEENRFLPENLRENFEMWQFKLFFSNAYFEINYHFYRPHKISSPGLRRFAWPLWDGQKPLRANQIKSTVWPTPRWFGHEVRSGC